MRTVATRSSTSSIPVSSAGRRRSPTPSRSSTPPIRRIPRSSTRSSASTSPTWSRRPPPARSRRRCSTSPTPRASRWWRSASMPPAACWSPGPTSCRCGAGTARPWCERATAPGTTSATGGCPLEIYTECRFEQTGSLITPADFATTTAASATASPPSAVAGQTFDSQLPGCVWHRLLLDAQVPTGTGVTVQARAADDSALLLQAPWLRPAGAVPAVRRRRAGLVRPVGRPAGGRRVAARRHRDLRTALPAGNRALPAGAS